jgi:hypothetical protein
MLGPSLPYTYPISIMSLPFVITTLSEKTPSKVRICSRSFEMLNTSTHAQKKTLQNNCLGESKSKKEFVQFLNAV